MVTEMELSSNACDVVTIPLSGSGGLGALAGLALGIGLLAACDRVPTNPDAGAASRTQITGGGDAMEDTLLLVSEREYSIIPISPAALCVGESSRRRIRQRNMGLLVIDRLGIARRIESIDIVGLHGNTLASKFWSALNSVWVISTVLSPPLAMELAELKSLLSRCLEQDAARPEPYLASQDEIAMVLKGVAASRSMAEVFDAIQVPTPKNSLDSL